MQNKLKFLSKKYLITGSFLNEEDFKKKLELQIFRGFNFIQLRIKNISESEYIKLAYIAKNIGLAKIILNTTPDIAQTGPQYFIHKSINPSGT